MEFTEENIYHPPLYGVAAISEEYGLESFRVFTRPINSLMYLEIMTDWIKTDMITPFVVMGTRFTGGK